MPAELNLNPAVVVEVATARRRGLKAGGEAILALAKAGAPREAGEPRHGVHGADTGFTRIEVGSPDVDTVAIGFEAFWMIYQEENLDYKHPNGHAKFLAGAMIEGKDVALDIVAANIAELLA